MIDAVSNLAHQKTIIIIAHCLSTVRAYDEIIMLEQERLETKGSYEELLKDNHRFRAMAVPVSLCPILYLVCPSWTE